MSGGGIKVAGSEKLFFELLPGDDCLGKAFWTHIKSILLLVKPDPGYTSNITL